MLPHYIRDLLLFGMCHVYVVLEEICERDVIILAMNELGRLLERLLDDSVSNLGVEDEVAEHIELIGECRLVLAEIVEYLHYLL